MFNKSQMALHLMILYTEKEEEEEEEEGNAYN